MRVASVVIWGSRSRASAPDIRCRSFYPFPFVSWSEEAFHRPRPCKIVNKHRHWMEWELESYDTHICNAQSGILTITSLELMIHTAALRSSRGGAVIATRHSPPSLYFAAAFLAFAHQLFQSVKNAGCTWQSVSSSIRVPVAA
jgi:hypothetical protein